MHMHGYWWTKDPSGQFIDGHKWADVVNYCQSHLLPEMACSNLYACEWDGAGSPLLLKPHILLSNGLSIGGMMNQYFMHMTGTTYDWSMKQRRQYPTQRGRELP